MPKTHRSHKEYARKIANICEKRGFDLTQHKEGIQLITINPHKKQAILIIGGIHGNEVAGPLGILEWLENSYVSKRYRLFIIPCANPYGFTRNIRRNSQNKDQNRRWCKDEVKIGENRVIERIINSKKFDFLYTVHEDHQAKKFYLYCSAKDKVLHKRIKNIALEYFSINRSAKIRGDKAKEGLIMHDEVYEKRNKRDCSIENYAYKNFNVNYLTTETPGRESLRKRTACTVKLLEFVVKKAYSS